MKKTLLFLIVFVVFACNIGASPVMQTRGEALAKNFFTITTGHTVNTIALAYSEADNTGMALYYVFNINPDQATEKGFVIVSAEDAIQPILAYGNENRTYFIPVKYTSGANVLFWMNKLKKEISKVRELKLNAEPAVANQWQYYLQASNKATQRVNKVQNSSFPSSNYYLVQSVWDQTSYGVYTPDPYNYFCPNHSVTGCVATATAQIMRYWRWPAYGIGGSCDSISDYANLITCDDYTHHYNWSDMELYPTAGDTNVARIMVDVGISIGMEYSPLASDAQIIDSDAIDSIRWKTMDTACAQNALVKYFKYDPKIIQGLYAVDYSNATWLTILKNELDYNRPIEYGGYLPDSSEGHAWICDGYDAFDNFHMNWGWGGYDDGWYALNDLVPPTVGVSFTTIIEALVGIRPDSSNTTGVQNISATTNLVSIYPNPNDGKYTVKSEGLKDKSSIEVYNMLGEKIYTKEIDNSATQINLSGNGAGIYLYRVITQTGALISDGKFIIQN